ncbi:MAG: hypothetical protein EBX50_01025 [Chitinophagia bacterium]|nr:hypothetical protein [Chitinophagia bacterium]
MKKYRFLMLIWGCLPFVLSAQSQFSLKEKVNQMIPFKNAVVGIAIGGPDERDTLSISGNTAFSAESALPFLISLAIMDRIDKGIMKPTDKIPVVDNGGTFSNKKNITDAPTLKELVSTLLQTGDQQLTALLLRHLGGAREFSRFIKSTGVRDITIIPADKEGKEEKLQIATHTPLSAIQLLRKFNFKNLLSEKSQQFLIETLSTSAREKKIAAGLPAGTKTVEISNGNNQVMGFISLPDGRTCTIAVFIADSSIGDALRDKIIKDVSKATWDFYVAVASDNFRLQYDYSAAIDSLLKMREKKKQAFNGNILITQGNRRVYNQSFGFADPKEKSNFATTDQFAIAQISEQMLATLVLLEAEKGKLDIKLPIGNYLNDLSQDWAKKVTIQHLLAHTDGLVSLEGSPVFTPGNQIQLNPVGQTLIIRLLEKTTGITFANLSANLFERLRMNNTAAPELKTKKTLVKTFQKDANGKWKVNPLLTDPVFENVGYLSNAADLVSWNMALHNQKVFSFPASYEQLISIQAITQHPLFENCEQLMGMLRIKQGEIEMFAQSGQAQGFSSLNVYYPATQTSVVVLSNTTDEDISKPLLEIINRSSLAVKIAKK